MMTWLTQQLELIRNFAKRYDENMPSGIYPRKSATERFREKVDKHGPKQPHMKTRCYLYTAFKLRGYGSFWYKGKQRRATHVRWYFHYGYFPKQVNHQCHNSSCVRLSHLYDGDHSQNMCDMIKADRQAKGEEIASAKLTRMHVWAIRTFYRWGWSQRALARKYDVDFSNIGLIVHRKSWKHLLPTEYYK